MRDWLKILLSVLALALLAHMAQDFHAFLEFRAQTIQDERSCVQSSLIADLDAKCSAMWPNDSDKCRQRVRQMVREDL